MARSQMPALSRGRAYLAKGKGIGTHCNARCEGGVKKGEFEGNKHWRAFLAGWQSGFASKEELQELN